jgi:lipopolysaccharide transport system ATP-binding protein
MKPVIRVENLSKRYRLGTRISDSYPTLRDTINKSVAGAWHGLRRCFGGSRNVMANSRAKNDAFWALKDVSFEVQPGEVVGIIGRNGAGKSTLLKVLSRIVEPTAGRCEVRGRMASLLEVGTGFHPELTGRENIYLNGSILGMSRKEINRKFDEIVAFSEVVQFIDMPVKRYSSGMYVRLAFAIAAHLQPEILILDEVLAVGDAIFQKKSLNKIREVASGGRTVLLVTHDMSAVRRYCGKVLLFESGRVSAMGTPEEIIPKYLAVNGQILLKPSEWIDLSKVNRTTSREAWFQAVSFYGSQPGSSPVSGGPLHINLQIKSTCRRQVDSLAVIIFDRSGLKLVNADSILAVPEIELKPGLNTVSMRIDRVYLNPGTYVLTLGLAKRPITPFDYIDVGQIEVIDEPGSVAVRVNGDGVVPCPLNIVTTKCMVREEIGLPSAML